MDRSIKPKKYFVMMRGIPGVGKSKISKAITRPLQAVIVKNDEIKNKLLKVLEFECATQIAYLTSYQLLFKNINAGHNVIFDSHALDLGIYKNCYQLAGRSHKLVVCECYCSDLDLWRKRLKKRTYKWQDTNPSVIIRKALKRIDVLPTKNVIKIDTAQPLRENVKRVLKFIRGV